MTTGSVPSMDSQRRFPTPVAACREHYCCSPVGAGDDTEKAQKRELDRAYIQLGIDRQHRPRFELLSARSLLRLLRSSSDGRPRDGTGLRDNCEMPSMHGSGGG